MRDPQVRRRRNSADDILDAVIDGTILGAGIGIISELLSSDNDSSSSSMDTSSSSDISFGGGDFGGAGAGDSW
jgi:uncharacterized membrane protein YgcG